MGFEAATRAIEMAGIEKDQIGLIVVATTSATHAFPSAACQIQSMLALKVARHLTLQQPAQVSPMH